MKFISAYYLLPLFPALVLGARQGYEELERQLKEVFKERSNILHQLSKTSKELQGIKVNLQSLKNEEASTKNDVQKLLELGQKHREEMKNLQEAFQKQLNEAAEKAEKQQTTINFLKTEMERKSKMIRDLQNEAQQLTDLEQKLAVAKDELEKTALDKESQLKALKETVQLCLSSVLHRQPPTTNLVPSNPAEKPNSPGTKGPRAPFQGTSTKVHPNASAEKENFHVALKKQENQSMQECDSQDVAKTCLGNRSNSTSRLKAAETEPTFQKLHSLPWTKSEDKKPPERNEKKLEESVSTKEKKL
ncbi:leucine zipper protein 2 isoform X2 [Pithys albifrons albifrons]|uniref:leucine zipper protein 2 isoform X2 n=1 Tax=Pithys albifrons albifrons TaxID=3385563 RepID=UPI003A5CE77B